jgi:hypothetical protein
MSVFDPNTFWNYVSSFFGFLNDKSKNMIENFWEGLNISGSELSDRANNFVDAQAPEYADTNVQENYYEISVSPLTSLPIKLDPTDINSRQMITPKSIITIAPWYNNGNPVYGDLIEISAGDYYNLRDVAINNYIVIIPKDNNIPIKYFKIKTLKSSEEDPNGDRYYPTDSIY